MKLSQNLFAETILQAAGGPEAVRAMLTEWSVEAGTVFVADGSGLSRYNLVTPDALVAVLARVHRDERLRVGSKRHCRWPGATAHSQTG